jgi:predicted nucleotidyltransferase
MLTQNQILSKLKEIKPLLTKDYSIKEIGLFGSFSNDTYTEDSDIDIIVELEKPIGWKYLTLALYLEKTFDRKIDLVTKNALKQHIRENIIKTVKYIN